MSERIEFTKEMKAIRKKHQLSSKTDYEYSIDKKVEEYYGDCS